MPTPYSSADPGRSRWSDLLQLVGAVRGVAFDASLPPIEAIGRVRDLYRDWDKRSRP
jgi:hypothetical protein